MGLLKRIFSIGTKRNKKKHTLVDPDPCQFPQLDHILEEEEQEAAASRLLRSSSSRYAVVSEFDYASCPALPHPINNVIQTPAASSISLSSTAATQRGTYTVTVHRRKQHTLTDFPANNPPISDDLTTPQDSSIYRSKSAPAISRDSNCLQGLRQDPSVASLLNMYDEHGRLPPSAFSNTPPSPAKGGRAQTRRNGSTLRQLLGNPASRSRRKVDNSGMEGDISWAERYLGETDSMASMSSVGRLETPTDPDTHFSDAHSHDDYLHTTLATQHAYDFSNNTSNSSAVSSSNYPAISSLEVEISMIADSPPIPGTPYQNDNPISPQRASQVFGFLMDKRKSIFADEMKAPLPGLHQLNINPGPSRFSDSSSDFMSQTSDRLSMYPDDPHCSLQASAQLRRTRSQSYPPTSTPSPPHECSPHYVRSQRRNSTSQDMLDLPRPPKVQVIITAPTPSDDQIARIPRGPRQQSKHDFATESYTKKPPQQHDVVNYRSQQLVEPYPTLHEVSNSTRPNSRLSSSMAPSKDPFTPIPPRQRRAHHRTISHTSTTSLAFPESGNHRPLSDVLDACSPTNREIWVTNGGLACGDGKENDLTGNVVFGLPVTPVRSRSLFGFSGRPSPASSTDLSPVGKQLMMNLRQQRTSAREAERQKKGMRLGASSGKVSLRG